MALMHECLLRRWTNLQIRNSPLADLATFERTLVGVAARYRVFSNPTASSGEQHSTFDVNWCGIVKDYCSYLYIFADRTVQVRRNRNGVGIGDFAALVHAAFVSD